MIRSMRTSATEYGFFNKILENWHEKKCPLRQIKTYDLYGKVPLPQNEHQPADFRLKSVSTKNTKKLYSFHKQSVFHCYLIIPSERGYY